MAGNVIQSHGMFRVYYIQTPSSLFLSIICYHLMCLETLSELDILRPSKVRFKEIGQNLESIASSRSKLGITPI